MCREAAEVRLDPPLDAFLFNGQTPPREVLFVTRHAGVTFKDAPPIAVHIADLRAGIEMLESIAWGQVHLTRAAALRWLRPMPGLLFGTLIVAFSLPSIAYSLFQLLPLKPQLELLRSPTGQSVWSFTTSLAYLSPVFFGLSLWLVRSMWATLSGVSKIVTGSILLLLLFTVLALIAGNVK